MGAEATLDSMVSLSSTADFAGLAKIPSAGEYLLSSTKLT